MWWQQNLFITATDTDVGKTLLSSRILRWTKGSYYKPIQTGPEGDRIRIQKETGLSDEHFLEEHVWLETPCSPHRAARIEGMTISLEAISIPQVKHSPLIVEGIGGILCPINDHEYVIDLARKIGFPIVVVTRSALGAINRTLLTLRAIQAQNLPVIGVVVVGPYHPDNEGIEEFGDVPILGRILDPAGERTWQNI